VTFAARRLRATLAPLVLAVHLLVTMSAQGQTRLDDKYRGFNNVVFHPDGRNSPPDFLISGGIAVEVRRLNQNKESAGGARGLEVSAIHTTSCGSQEGAEGHGPSDFRRKLGRAL
jgi:hypothetical protein